MESFNLWSVPVSTFLSSILFISIWGDVTFHFVKLLYEMLSTKFRLLDDLGPLSHMPTKIFSFIGSSEDCVSCLT